MEVSDHYSKGAEVLNNAVDWISVWDVRNGSSGLRVRQSTLLPWSWSKKDFCFLALNMGDARLNARLEVDNALHAIVDMRGGYLVNDS